MATIQNRPFSRNYSRWSQDASSSPLSTAHEYMKKKRRGRRYPEGLGSVESWQFGYLYQGRSWAKRPSPPHPRGWPLGWVKQVLAFPEDRMNELRGVDATLYTRFLRGCLYFTLLQTLTTLPILLPIHVTFSDGSVSPKSMTRASISSLVLTAKGLSLLWVHIVLLFWITFTWIATLYWICRGAFRFRAQKIVAAANRAACDAEEEKIAQYNPHPHPQYPFHALPQLDDDKSNRGLRLRTVMVTNIPAQLRSEKDLKEYFEYYMSRHVARPTLGITSSTQPGFLNKTFAFLFNRARRLPTHINRARAFSRSAELEQAVQPHEIKPEDVPTIDRVVLVRRMSELASLLERREEVLRLLETAHIKLARKTLTAIKDAIDRKEDPGLLRTAVHRMSMARSSRKSGGQSLDVEGAAGSDEGTTEGEDRMQLLTRTLRPYLSEADAPHPSRQSQKTSFWPRSVSNVDPSPSSHARPLPPPVDQEKTVWEALLSLPRSTLDTYQPLIHLSSLFRGKTVPAIDYYTAKLQLLTSLITEKRAIAVADYEPMSTAFVTFVDPADARRACKYLAVHPSNPLQCLVTMAPSYEDLDWTRLMKSTFRVEFVKDWVVELGVWGFTIFWVFPVSFFVGLVSIDNISTFWPGLAHYLNRHDWEEELIQSFLPTVLVALLSLLIPLLLLLIAKRAHTIATLSALHDRIMTRYYKFLIVNVLVFFCVGTAALQSFLVSFKATSAPQIISVISQSFPVAGPFYVGCHIHDRHAWGFELALFGLPLIMYPSTKRQVTPRKRAVGIRPRTFNYYYWLPNHMLVIHVIMVFSVLNPLVIPFAFIYFCVEATVVKNQLLHVYAKNYEGNGQLLLIRMIRYSLDGLILAQVVFLAYMVVNMKTANVALSAVLIVVTAIAKVLLTRICRARYERDDFLEAQIICRTGNVTEDVLDTADPMDGEIRQAEIARKLEDPQARTADLWTWRLPIKINFPYATIHRRPSKGARRRPNPFGPSHTNGSDTRLHPTSSTAGLLRERSVTAGPSLAAWQESDVVEDNSPITSEDLSRPKPVARHPPHPAWDDESSPNHPYDNPFYTRAISDVLWLPRDPLGLLDLDDTIDLRISLTCQPSAGKLGAWPEDNFIVTGLSGAFPTSIGSFDDALSFTTQYRHLDGTEEIDLPADIASRVESIYNEDDVEVAIPRRPSHFKRRRASDVSTPPNLGVRRPSTFDAGSALGFRSFSLNSGPSGSSRGPPSFLSSSDRRRRNRSVSVDHELGMRTDSQTRPSQMARSTLSVVDSPASASFTNIRNPMAPRVVSTTEAVRHEVLKEEQDVLEESLVEDPEAGKVGETRSWLTSWMFAKDESS
ncbi:hypothetical protein A0H81_08778 [Grifola frondosa]|uniref:Calcium permeable stress-gated cation channel 1 n=1 Tax=Grifola frondosa TaxID=5627 RepID=A0A1C7M389_GRIFR|nr:hypothetical protein A0H81_08778 [Grifola frondosa]